MNCFKLIRIATMYKETTQHKKQSNARITLEDKKLNIAIIKRR